MALQVCCLLACHTCFRFVQPPAAVGCLVLAGWQQAAAAAAGTSCWCSTGARGFFKAMLQQVTLIAQAHLGQMSFWVGILNKRRQGVGFDAIDKRIRMVHNCN